MVRSGRGAGGLPLPTRDAKGGNRHHGRSFLSAVPGARPYQIGLAWLSS